MSFQSTTSSSNLMYFSERIWSTFDEKISIVEPSDYPIDEKRDIIIQVVDPHDGRPCACIWLALKDNGRIVVFNETPKENSRPFWEIKKYIRLEDEVVDWNDIENDLGFKPRKRIIDKRFGFQTRGGRTIANILSDSWDNIGHRQSYLPSYKNDSDMGEIAYGHQTVRKHFLPMEDGVSGIVIWNSCYHTINGVKHYVRQRPRTQIQMQKTSEDMKIIEKYKDFNDCLRYGVVECDNLFNMLTNKEKRAKKKIRRNYYNDPLLAV